MQVLKMQVLMPRGHVLRAVTSTGGVSSVSPECAVERLSSGCRCLRWDDSRPSFICGLTVMAEIHVSCG